MAFPARHKLLTAVAAPFVVVAGIGLSVEHLGVIETGRLVGVSALDAIWIVGKVSEGAHSIANGIIDACGDVASFVQTFKTAAVNALQDPDKVLYCGDYLHSDVMRGDILSKSTADLSKAIEIKDYCRGHETSWVRPILGLTL